MNYLAGVVNLSKVCPGLDVGGQDLWLSKNLNSVESQSPRKDVTKIHNDKWNRLNTNFFPKGRNREVLETGKVSFEQFISILSRWKGKNEGREGKSREGARKEKSSAFHSEK